MKESEEFVDQLTASQSKLFGCIMTSVANATDARDILQRTNLTLWKNVDRYDPSRPFLPWAIATARLQIRSYYRDQKRERLVFDHDILNELQAVADRRVEDFSLREEALRTCLTKMPEEHRSVLSMRYAHGKSVDQISAICGRTSDGVRSLMLRLRKSLRGCIEHQLSQ